MSTTKTASKASFASNLGQSLRTVAKLLLQSHRCHLGSVATDHRNRIIILGNGPSLAQTIAESANVLRQSDTMAVNFAANAPEFKLLQPTYYILADPHFFAKRDDANVSLLFDNLNAITWPMTLLLPFAARKQAPKFTNRNITVAYYNAIGAEGFRWLTDIAYSSGRAMPRPRNVLIPAIMTAIQLGYKEILIAGADHSWTRTLSVDDDNNVVSIQPHFYKEDDREVERIRKEYHKYPLHIILQSMYLAFRSYHVIADYAHRHAISIINITPSSFIDAFPRSSLK